MNKLLKVPTKIWFFIVGIISMSLVALYFLLNSKVEMVSKARITIRNDLATIVSTNMQTAYSIKNHSTLTISLNGKYYKTYIKSITYNPETKLYDLSTNGLDLGLIRGSVLDAQLIYGENKVLDIVLNRSV